MKYGIIGGYGSYATLLLHKLILDGVKNPQTDFSYPEFVIYNTTTVPLDEFGNVSEVHLNELLKISNWMDCIDCDKIYIDCCSIHTQQNIKKITSVCTKIVDWFSLFKTSEPLFASFSYEVLQSRSSRDNNLFYEINQLNYSRQRDVDYFINGVIAGSHRDFKFVTEFYNYLESFGFYNVILGCTELSVLFDMFTPEMKTSRKYDHDCSKFLAGLIK